MGLANEAGWDRAGRIVLGLALFFISWAGVVSGTVGSVFMIVGVLSLLTGIIGWCPIYFLFDTSTRKPDPCC